MHGRKQQIIKGMYEAKFFGNPAEVEASMKYNDRADKLTLYAQANKEFTKQELEGFELSKLLGVNCTLQIIHKKKDDRVYANIANILPLMDKALKKEPENPLKHFILDNGMDIPEGTPDWIRAKITQSKEWQERIDPSLPQEPDPKYGHDSPPVEEYDDQIHLYMNLPNNYQKVRVIALPQQDQQLV